MRPRAPWYVPLLAAGALLATACDRPLIEPDDAIEEFDILWDLEHAGPGDPDARQQRVAILVRLFQNALQRVAVDQGRDEAAAVLARVDALRQDARALRDAGDLDGARERLEQARRVMAATVIRAFGDEPVHRLIAAVGERADHVASLIAEREAAGHDTAALRRFHAHVTGLAATARGALARGQPVLALDYACRAAEALARFQDRLTS